MQVSMRSPLREGTSLLQLNSRKYSPLSTGLAARLFPRPQLRFSCCNCVAAARGSTIASIGTTIASSLRVVSIRYGTVGGGTQGDVVRATPREYRASPKMSIRRSTSACAIRKHGPASEPPVRYRDTIASILPSMRPLPQIDSFVQAGWKPIWTQSTASKDATSPLLGGEGCGACSAVFLAPAASSIGASSSGETTMTTVVTR
jgi:hypothetical protein